MGSDVIIATAEDEVVLRQYTISELDYRTKTYKSRKIPHSQKSKYNTTGTLYVTNRRLIYNVDNTNFPRFGLKCSDLYSQQMRIEDIQGIDFMTSSMKGSLIKPLLVVILGILILFTGLLPVSVLLIVLGAFWTFIRYRNVERSMMFGIKSSACNYGMYISEMSRGYAGQISFWCAPTDDFEMMAKELGAIVLDIQKYGDECISKYILN